MKIIIFVLTVVVFFAAPLVFAEAEHAMHSNEMAQEGDMQSAQEGPVDVGNKICPVSGEEISEEMKASYEYEGKIYNFCCAGCIDEFSKDPAKYIEKIKEKQSPYLN
ncbi:MAG: YHS domain-containing protein [Candidatus Omnitrophota bacterium]